MSEFHFGFGRGRIKARERRKIDAIAARHGASFVNPDLPGDGWSYWFSCPNRGEPFDRDTAHAVDADLERAGLTDEGGFKAEVFR